MPAIPPAGDVEFFTANINNDHMRRAVGCHTFRATGITAYLANGGALEHGQEMAAHESPRTTKLYDRTKDRLSRTSWRGFGCECAPCRHRRRSRREKRKRHVGDVALSGHQEQKGGWGDHTPQDGYLLSRN
jgi:hypothetical protein